MSLQPNGTKSELSNAAPTVNQTLSELAAGREPEIEYMQTNEIVLLNGKSVSNTAALPQPQPQNGIINPIDTHHDSIQPNNHLNETIDQTPQYNQRVMLTVGFPTALSVPQPQPQPQNGIINPIKIQHNPGIPIARDNQSDTNDQTSQHNPQVFAVGNPTAYSSVATNKQPHRKPH